jgi:hypothetical protein
MKHAGVSDGNYDTYNVAQVRMLDPLGSIVTVTNGQAAEPLEDGDLVVTTENFLPGVWWRKQESSTLEIE